MILDNPRLDWLKNPDIRPYVYVREENRIKEPGSAFNLDWFQGKPPVYINPMHMKEVNFGNQILQMESQAFGTKNMEMPRWVFFDCSVVPGFVAGFAIRSKSLDGRIRDRLLLEDNHEWTPLSLFIIIPTMGDGEWVAHNLCSINSLVNKEDRMYGLGFLSKAFGLWYANVKTCVGFTQWGNGAIRLHSYYGPFQILTSFTPLHSYPRTLTYRVETNPKMWPHFLTKTEITDFSKSYKLAGKEVDPENNDSLKSLQNDLEGKKGPYFLNSQEILSKPIGAPLDLYIPR